METVRVRPSSSSASHLDEGFMGADQASRQTISVEGPQERHADSTLADQVLLLRLSSPRYELQLPLLLDVVRRPEGGFVVHADELLTYGAGSSLPEAIIEFSSMLVDLFEELEAAGDEELAARMRDVRGRLRDHLIGRGY